MHHHSSNHWHELEHRAILERIYWSYSYTLTEKGGQQFTFHSSSNLLICCAVICRARICSSSDGTFTSQDKKQRSWISGCHCVASLSIQNHKNETLNWNNSAQARRSQVKIRLQYILTSSCPSGCSDLHMAAYKTKSNLWVKILLTICDSKQTSSTVYRHTRVPWGVWKRKKLLQHNTALY